MKNESTDLLHGSSQCRYSLRRALGTLILLTAIFSSGPVLAKCATARLDISGQPLTEPLTINNPNIVGRFSIWHGPSVRVNNEPVHLDPGHQRSAFIDWPSGIAVSPPKNATKFSVSFYCLFDESEPLRKIYEVDYMFAPGSFEGFIFLPGEDDTRFRSNTSSIVHFVEGAWFRSSLEWERVIRPIVEDAIRRMDQSRMTSPEMP